MGVSKKPGEMVFERAIVIKDRSDQSWCAGREEHATYRTCASHGQETCRSGGHQLSMRCKRTTGGNWVSHEPMRSSRRWVQAHLVEGNVDDVSRDRGSSDERTGTLGLEDGADSLGSVEDRVEVDGLDLAPFLNGELVDTARSSLQSVAKQEKFSFRRE